MLIKNDQKRYPQILVGYQHTLLIILLITIR